MTEGLSIGTNRHLSLGKSSSACIGRHDSSSSEVVASCSRNGILQLRDTLLLLETQSLLLTSLSFGNSGGLLRTHLRSKRRGAYWTAAGTVDNVRVTGCLRGPVAVGLSVYGSEQGSFLIVSVLCRSRGARRNRSRCWHGLDCCSHRRRYADSVRIVARAALDSVTRRQEGVEALNKLGVTGEEGRDTFDDARCVNTVSSQHLRRVGCGDRHIRPAFEVLHDVQESVVNIWVVDKLDLDLVEVAQGILWTISSVKGRGMGEPNIRSEWAAGPGRHLLLERRQVAWAQAWPAIE